MPIVVPLLAPAKKTWLDHSVIVLTAPSALVEDTCFCFRSAIKDSMSSVFTHKYHLLSSPSTFALKPIEVIRCCQVFSSEHLEWLRVLTSSCPATSLALLCFFPFSKCVWESYLLFKTNKVVLFVFFSSDTSGSLIPSQ